MHSIKMYDAADLMPRLMIIHSTADLYAARRQNVSQLKKTLDGAHAVTVLRYQSKVYATIIKARSDHKATAESESEHSTEGEHQFQEASEGQSMTDTTMTRLDAGWEVLAAP